MSNRISIYAALEKAMGQNLTERDSADFPMVGKAARRLLIAPARECDRFGIPSAHEARERCEFARRIDEVTFTHFVVANLSAFVESATKHGQYSHEARAELVRVGADVVAMLDVIDQRTKESR